MYASIRELKEANPEINWYNLAPPRVKGIIDGDPTVLDVTAQTVVAASYGLFQILYTTAIWLKWEGKKGDKSPRYLFDTDDNLMKGGGTFELAGAYHRYLFKRVNPPGTLENAPPFQSDGELLNAFGFSFTAYNQGPPKKNKPPIITQYWTKVLDAAKKRQPVPTGTIF